MEIRNLDINILYHICTSCGSGQGLGCTTARELAEEFADIQEALHAAVAVLQEQGLIHTDDARTRLSITRKGVDRLQSRIAFKEQGVDRCRLPHPSRGVASEVS